MRKSLLALLCVLAGSLCQASTSDYGDWFKTFYKTDDVGRFDGFWKSVLEEKTLEKGNALAPTCGFLSQVLHRHPELIAGRLDDLKKFSEAEQKAIMTILWYSDTEEARSVLKANGHARKAKETFSGVGSKPIAQSGDLDFCWGCFFASGDVNALKPIIAALDNAKYAGALDRYKTSKKTEEDKAAAYKEAIFKAAMWSLGANGKENQLVLDYLEKNIADMETKDDRRLWLGVILSKLKPEKYKVDFAKGKGATLEIVPAVPQPTKTQPMGWRDKSGNPITSTDTLRSVDGFSASVVVTADPDWAKKWETPPEVTPQFSHTERIHVGERVMCLVFFAGPLADINGEVDVRYDVTIRRPNGEVTTQKDLKGVKGKLSGPATNTYLVKALIGFVGESGDPLGDWGFEFSVHDVVRNVTVPLKTKITLEAASAAIATPVP